MYGWSVNISADPAAARAASYQDTVFPQCGIMAGTLVASHSGWRAVEELSVGDRVHTFDNGMQPIVEIKRQIVWSDPITRPNEVWPVVIPAGVLGNTQQMVFLPDQGLMLESENACDAMGDPYAVMPAQILEGLCGVACNPATHQMELFTLIFARDEVVYVDGSLMVHCPIVAPQPDPDTLDDEPYDVVNLDEAKEMFTDLDLAELTLRGETDDFFGRNAMGAVA